jgi:hypothetical protein
VNSLVLGAQTYSKTELLGLLRTASLQDASLILAGQLIAAKLNIAAGAASSSIAPSVAAADSWLRSYPGKLPYRVSPFSREGQVALGLAFTLALYNYGVLPGGPPHCDENDRATLAVDFAIGKRQTPPPLKVDSDPGGRSSLAVLLLLIAAVLTRRVPLQTSTEREAQLKAGTDAAK